MKTVMYDDVVFKSHKIIFILLEILTTVSNLMSAMSHTSHRIWLFWWSYRFCNPCLLSVRFTMLLKMEMSSCIAIAPCQKMKTHIRLNIKRVNKHFRIFDIHIYHWHTMRNMWALHDRCSNKYLTNSKT